MPNESFHHQEVQEIMVTSPGWALKWGNMVIASILLLFLVSSVFFTYPVTLSTDIRLASVSPPILILPDGIHHSIDTMMAPNNTYVKKGTAIFSWGDSPHTTVYAPAEGVIQYSLVLTHMALPGSATDPIAYIQPNVTSFIAIGTVGPEAFSKIRMGLEVMVSIGELNNQKQLKGEVCGVSPTAGAREEHRVFMKINNPLHLTINPSYSGNAKIFLENKPVLSKIFGIRL